MITGSDFYTVVSAMAPLYTAMLLAFAAVRWWRVFTPEQCAGINRFVAAFAVPVLSFHFISFNNPFLMDARFLLADTVSKLAVLLLLGLWVVLFGSSGSAGGGGDGVGWVITLFSVATLPNTLVMGIPLLKAMYGDFTQSLMVQVVVLQCIVWYTLLLFLFEYRAARVLIRDQFPSGAAAAIAAITVDPDVLSLTGDKLDPLRADAEPLPSSTSGASALRIRIRRSSAPPSASVSATATPRLSSLSSAEIYSAATPGRARTLADLALGGRSPAISGCASSDAYSLQPTPRASNFNEMETGTPACGRSPATAAIGTPSPADAKHSGEKELSFRSTTKFMEGEEEEGEYPEMPSPLVMLKLILTVVCRKLSRNPNTYSSVLGLLWSLISFKWQVSMPSLVLNSIKIISDAGLGMAMFSLGLFMALQPRIIACGARMAGISMAIRFISGPMIMSAASMVVGLRGVQLHTAIVQAALPQGIVPFVFAREYGLHPDILSTGVIFGMLVSLPVTLLYYILLGL